MEESRILSLNLFLNTMAESCENEKRYCFILGAGASKTSGIPTGEEMAAQWREELDRLYANCPEELQRLQRRLNVRSLKPSSKNYFSLYAMRFFPDYRNGSAFLERALERAQPSLGYYPLAALLARTRNNLLITTNFDSLVEDALFIYTEKKPMVVSHELLADYINFNTSRPIVAKLHRGLFFNPLNRAEEVNGLSEKWKKTLHNAFKIYTPVVVGYAGGDHSLMDFLKNEAELDCIYWCYRGEEPSDEIQRMVERHKGYFVPIEGFDEMMYLLGQKFEYKDPCERIKNVADQRIRDYTEQVKAFEEKLNAVADPSETQNQILEALSQKQREDLERLDRRIEENEKDAEAYEERGKIFHNAEKYQQAVEDFTKAVQLGRESGMLYWYKGYSEMQLGHTDAGFQDYSRSLELHEYAGVRYNRGLIYSRWKEYEKAIADFTRAIELEPGRSQYRTQRAIAYYNLGEVEKVIEDCEKAIELGQPDADTYKFLADGQRKRKEFDKAIENYGKAIGLNSKFSAAYNNRGVAYEALNLDQQALADYRKAARLTTRDPLYHSNAGNALKRLGRYKEAVTSYNKAIKLKPDDADLYRRRAEAYDALGQSDKAERDREKHKQLSGQS